MSGVIEPWVATLKVEFHADPTLPEDVARQMLSEVVDAVNEIGYVSSRHMVLEGQPKANCRRCGRSIELVEGRWIDPEATGDDVIWRETCDENHEDRAAEHEPVEPGVLFLAEAETRHYTWRAAGSTEVQARERLRQAYLAESEDSEEGAATLAEEANVYQLSPGVALRDDYRIPE